ncbi:MAG: hypothetical protein H6838_12925 [Planctomycetes bacterium]|nr:hypothetical protein [Planctomycetota bacterium]MCB9886391.1 hypothetical protein [Planctomycetota bacterium]
MTTLEVQPVSAPAPSLHKPPRPSRLAKIPWIILAWLLLMTMPLGILAVGVPIMLGFSLVAKLFDNAPDWIEILGVIGGALVTVNLYCGLLLHIGYGKRLRRLYKDLPDATGEVLPVCRVLSTPEGDNEQDSGIRNLLAVTPKGLAVCSDFDKKSRPFGERLDGTYSQAFLPFASILEVAVQGRDEESLTAAARSSALQDGAVNLVLRPFGVRTTTNPIAAYVLVAVLSDDGSVGTWVFGIPAKVHDNLLTGAEKSIREHRQSAVADAVGALSALDGVGGAIDLASGAGAGFFDTGEALDALAEAIRGVTADRAVALATAVASRIRELAGLQPA